MVIITLDISKPENVGVMEQLNTPTRITTLDVGRMISRTEMVRTRQDKAEPVRMAIKFQKFNPWGPQFINEPVFDKNFERTTIKGSALFVFFIQRSLQTPLPLRE
jgi:hypothetical protein